MQTVKKSKSGRSPVTLLTLQKIVQSRDLQIKFQKNSSNIKNNFPQNTENMTNLTKYERKMYLMHFNLFCPGDLVTHMGGRESWHR